MKNIKHLIAIVLFTGTCIFYSCDYLSVDGYFDETLKYDSVFSNKINLEKYLWGAAAIFPDEGSFIGHNATPGVFACDEAFILGPLSEYRGMDYVLGAVSPDNLIGFDTWADMYKVIRKANTILARIDEATDLTSFERMETLGYTYMLRAYAYYRILMDFGPVVILGDDVLETNMQPEYYERSRATYDESVDYICEEFEKAAQYLPLNINVTNFGRPSKGAALAMVARLRLQQASPLFNGGSAARSYYGSWTRSEDGVHYISQNYDEKKWAVAAMAAKRVMDMGRYSLHTVQRDLTLDDAPILPPNVPMAPFPDGAGGIDPYRSYADMFNGEILAQRNPEIIWGTPSTNQYEAIKNYTRHSFSMSDMGGWNQACITQKVVDSFYMADGGTTDKPGPYYTYNTVGTNDTVFSGYTLKNNVHPMYVNREIRFYANVGFSGRYWTASSTTESNRKEKQITYGYLKGNSGIGSLDGNSPQNYPATGYVITKYIHPDDAWAGTGAQIVPKSFPTIRYAEILLSYVEALNNLTQSHTIEDYLGNSYTVSRNEDEMKKYFNQIHYRVGLPGLPDKTFASVAEMQSAIERERMIEFVWENRRYYDVRRWGIYEETESAHFMGMDMFQDDDAFYSVVPINHQRARSRIVNKRMVFLPLSRNEVRKVKLLDQNPGWGD